MLFYFKKKLSSLKNNKKQVYWSVNLIIYVSIDLSSERFVDVNSYSV